MAEYKYKDMANEQGWGMTFDANGRFPIIGSRIFPTLDDLNEFVGRKVGTAIAGVTLGVVADPVAENNGTYEVSFIDTTLVDSEGRVLFWDDANNRSNLKATKLGSGGGSNPLVPGNGIDIDGNDVISAKIGDGLEFGGDGDIAVKDAVVTMDSENDTLVLTQEGKLNSSVLEAIEAYIDDFDCGEY